MNIQFNHLSPSPTQNHANHSDIAWLWESLYHNEAIKSDVEQLTCHLSDDDWQNYKSTWQMIDKTDDKALTDWLIGLFNAIYDHPKQHTRTLLVRGDDEPEYLAPKDGNPAYIVFAHGFFASSLHEISHWCVAGKKRRLLDDFGYWYCPDGRDEATQALFEQVEIKPQAIECLLNLALGRYFYVSQDNLNAYFDTSSSHFAQDVYDKALSFLQNPATLPPDAKRLIWVFLSMAKI